MEIELLQHRLRRRQDRGDVAGGEGQARTAAGVKHDLQRRRFRHDDRDGVGQRLAGHAGKAVGIGFRLIRAQDEIGLAEQARPAVRAGRLVVEGEAPVGGGQRL